MKKIFLGVLMSILCLLSACGMNESPYIYFIGYDNYEDFVEVSVTDHSDVVRIKIEANQNIRLDDVTLKVDLHFKFPFFGTITTEHIELKASQTRQAMLDYEITLYEYVSYEVVSVFGLVGAETDINPELTIKQEPLKEIYKHVKAYQNSDTFYLKSLMKIDDIEEEMEI